MTGSSPTPRRLLLAAVLAFLAAACAPVTDRPEAETATPTASPTPGPLPGVTLPPCTWARVTRVVDGDTIDVDLAGATRRVRYIGMDTPEVYGGVEPFGREASAFNTALVMGRHVCLERDISEVDRYQRLLRYIWLPDGRMVNEELLFAGLATVSTYPPDVKYTQSRFLPAQARARDQELGMWKP